AKDRDWPKQAHTLSGRLRRITPNLRAVGVVVEFDRQPGGKRTRTVRLTRSGKVGEGASQAAQPSRNGGSHAETNGHPGRSGDAPPDPGRSIARKRPGPTVRKTSGKRPTGTLGTLGTLLRPTLH